MLKFKSLEKPEFSRTQSNLEVDGVGCQNVSLS